MAKVTLSLYGAMRVYENGAPLAFEIEDGADRAELRNAIIAYLKISEEEVFETCALATDQEIIGSDYLVSGDVEISILPPVCGG